MASNPTDQGPLSADSKAPAAEGVIFDDHDRHVRELGAQDLEKMGVAPEDHGLKGKNTLRFTGGEVVQVHPAVAGALFSSPLVAGEFKKADAKKA